MLLKVDRKRAFLHPIVLSTEVNMLLKTIAWCRNMNLATEYRRHGCTHWGGCLPKWPLMRFGNGLDPHASCRILHVRKRIWQINRSTYPRQWGWFFFPRFNASFSSEVTVSIGPTLYFVPLGTFWFVPGQLLILYTMWTKAMQPDRHGNWSGSKFLEHVQFPVPSKEPAENQINWTEFEIVYIKPKNPNFSLCISNIIHILHESLSCSWLAILLACSQFPLACSSLATLTRT